MCWSVQGGKERVGFGVGVGACLSGNSALYGLPFFFFFLIARVMAANKCSH